ncbi:MAG: flagellar biosynthesis anti-sigma factor FlgM [Burkholderiaceae bacterium]|nr:flagellar biosynthesis anti-sigma factor FlgM [Burkholderiaceae bacterium]
MKIGHLENSSVTPAVGERKPGAATAPAAAAGTVGVEPSAKVALSTTVSQLAAGGGDGVFDAEKVKRISDAIRDGQFKVNPEAIADKLIANAQELLGRTGKA